MTIFKSQQKPSRVRHILCLFCSNLNEMSKCNSRCGLFYDFKETFRVFEIPKFEFAEVVFWQFRHKDGNERLTEIYDKLISGYNLF